MLARQLPVSHLKPILRAGNSGGAGGGCVLWIWLKVLNGFNVVPRSRGQNQVGEPV